MKTINSQFYIREYIKSLKLKCKAKNKLIKALKHEIACLNGKLELADAINKDLELENKKLKGEQNENNL